MATAGRLLIIPKGKYSENMTYEKLDMVSYDGKGWICKKTCIGITPAEGEYWAEAIDVSEEIDEVNSKINSVERVLSASIAAEKSERISSINSTESKLNSDIATEKNERKADIRDLQDEINDLDSRVDQIANNQIPDEYLQKSVDEYMENNDGGLATKEDVAELDGKLSSEIVDVKSKLSESITDIQNGIITIEVKANFVSGAYAMDSDAHTITLGANPKRVSSDYLALYSNKKLIINATNGWTFQVRRLDKNDGTYTEHSNTDYVSNAEYIASDGYKYALITMRYGDGSTKISVDDAVANITVQYVNNIADVIFSKKKNNKILTWIDDDARTEEYTDVVRTICDNLGIRCTFAVVSDRFDTSEGYSVSPEKLLEYQEQGYHITCHTGNHTRWYKADGDLPKFTLEEIEADLTESLVTLNGYGFIDCNMLVYPGSSEERTGVQNIVEKWCECGVRSTGDNWSGYGEGRYLINRTFIENVNSLSYYQNLIDNADSDAWVVFGTHSGDRTNFDATLTEEVLSYAISKGFTVMTLNQAYKNRKHNFIIQEMFGM